MKKIIPILLVLTMLFSLTACSLEDIPTYNNFIKTINKEDIEEELAAEEQNVIKIGVLEPITGQYSQDCIDEVRGVELANRLFPKVLDQKVELIVVDNESSADVAQEKVQDLIDQGCKVIIGSCNNILTLAISDYTEAAHIPLIIPSCTNPLLTTTNESAYRICIVEAFQGNSAAKYMTEYMPYVLQLEAVDENIEFNYEQKLATKEEINTQIGTPSHINCVILKNDSDERASALIDSFQNKMENLFGDDGFTKVVEYPNGTENMALYFEEIQNAGADAVFFPSTAAEGEKILYMAKDLGYDFLWVGVSDWAKLGDAASEALREDINHLEGAAYVQGFDAKAEISTTMVQNLKSAAKRYYDVDEPSQSMSQAFDAYLIALEGIRNAGLGASTWQIVTEISLIKEFEGATGSITYLGGSGDPVKDVVIEKYVNGEPIVDYIAAPNFGL